MDQPLVSIGIPCYNRPEGLRKTLQCATRQSYLYLEVIVSNNCSPDEVVDKIALEYARKDNRVSYVRQKENIGAAANFEYVLAQAKGEYFLWMSDDDEWSQDFISECVGLLETAPDIGMAFTNFENVTPWGRKYRETLSPQRYAGTASWQAVLKFILIPEYFGVANIIYSVFRTRLLRELVATGVVTHEPTAYASDISLVLGGIERGGLIVSDKFLFKKFISPDQWRRPESDETFVEIDFSSRNPSYIGSFLMHPEYLYNNLLISRNTRYYYLVFILCYFRIMEEIIRRLFYCDFQVIKSFGKFILWKALSKDKYNKIKEKFKRK